MRDHESQLVLKKHQGVWVVRDDLMPYGSKSRFLTTLLDRVKEKEIVFGSSPRWGYAQISLAYLSQVYGKKLTLFLPKAKELSPYSRKAICMGAKIIQVPMGFLTVCEARAKRHAEENDAYLLLCGLDHPKVVNEIARWGRTLPLSPDEIWSVASSGTLSRGLQKAFPDAKTFAVQIGKKLDSDSVGRAKVIVHDQQFSAHAKEPPPFPAVPEYDAKAWKYIPKDGKKIRLFWNVGCPVQE